MHGRRARPPLAHTLLPIPFHKLAIFRCWRDIGTAHHNVQVAYDSVNMDVNGAWSVHEPHEACGRSGRAYRWYHARGAGKYRLHEQDAANASEQDKIEHDQGVEERGGTVRDVATKAGDTDQGRWRARAGGLLAVLPPVLGCPHAMRHGPCDVAHDLRRPTALRRPILVAAAKLLHGGGRGMQGRRRLFLGERAHRRREKVSGPA